MSNERGSAAIVDFRRPSLVMLDSFVSHSGRYFCFFGLHYKTGKTCYDVGYSNKQTGEIIRRHYNEDENLAPEASAKTYWEEFKEKMQRKLPLEEEPQFLEQLHQWLDINQPNWRKSLPQLKRPS